MFPSVDTIWKFNPGIKHSIGLFQKLISPIVLYGSEIWSSFSNHQLKKLSKDPSILSSLSIGNQIEIVQLKFLKLILGLRRNCATLAVLGEVSEFPIALNGLVRMIKFWHRINNMEDGRLTKKALNVIESSQSDISNWLSTVKLSMKALSLDNIFSSPSCYSSTYVERMFKAKIRESFIQYWNSELNIADVNSIRNSKLRTYKMFKSKFAMEDCFINLHDFESRKIVAKFRRGDHTLMIETGRHKKIDLEERMCKMCSQKMVEDERHFLLECPAYNKVRKSLMKHVDPNEDDLNNQFIQLMASSNQNVIHDIAGYLKRAFKIRSNPYEQISHRTSFCFQSLVRWDLF